MKVWLQNDWFSQDGNYYRKDQNPHEFPDDYLEFLPSSAKLGDKEDTAKVVKEVRNDPPPPAQISLADVAAKDLEIQRLKEELARLAGQSASTPTTSPPQAAAPVGGGE